MCFRDFSTLNSIFLPFGEQVRGYMIERRCQASSGCHFALPNSYIHPTKLCSAKYQHLVESPTPGPSPSSSWDPPPSLAFPLSPFEVELRGAAGLQQDTGMVAWAVECLDRAVRHLTCAVRCSSLRENLNNRQHILTRTKHHLVAH